MRRHAALSALIALAAGAATAPAQTGPATAPGTAPAPGPESAAETPAVSPDARQAPPAVPAGAAVVVAVEGKVQTRASADAPWAIAAPGNVVPEGGAVRTGPRSAVRLRIGTGQLLTIDRLGVVEMSTLAREESADGRATERTRVDLAYGRLLFDVDSSRVDNDVRIQAPDATLAVRGTLGAIDVTPGRPTLAYGTPGNTGSFAVTNDRGQTGVVQGETSTSTDTPSPAQRADQGTRLDTSEPSARDDDENDVVDRSTGQGTAAVLSTGVFRGAFGASLIDLNDPRLPGLPGGEQPGDPGGPIGPVRPDIVIPVGVGTPGALFRLRDVVQPSTSFPNALPLPSNGVDPAQAVGGLDAAVDLPDQITVWYVLGGEITDGGDKVFNELYRATIDRDGSGPAAGWDLVARFAEGGTGEPAAGGSVITGLAQLDGTLYATTALRPEGDLPAAEFALSELDLNDGSLVRRMDLRTPLLAADGADGRGSVFLAGRLAPLSETGQTFADTVLFEVDPEINHLFNTWWGAAGDLAFDDDTFDPSFIGGDDDASLETIDGLAYSGGTLSMLATTDGGREAIVAVNVDATSDRLQGIFAPAGPAVGLAGAGVDVVSGPSPPMLVDPADGRVDLVSINATFAQMSYGTAALRSGALQRIFTDHFVATSLDPTKCANSTILDQVPAALLNNAGTVNGIGRATFELRDPLASGHPCSAGG